MKFSKTSRTKILESRQDLKNLEVSNIHSRRMDKRGFLRILEAILAVLIILGALLFVVMKNNAQDAENSGDSLCKEAEGILEEISKNNSLRESVLDRDDLAIHNFLRIRINNPLIDYRVKICNPDELCSLSEGGLDKIDVCASERLITTTPSRTEFQPKKLKVFLFRLR